MSTTYRTVTVTRRGGLDAVEWRDHPLRVPGPGEARIRIIATPVCQDDVAIRTGDRPFLRRPPYVPGYSFIGIIDELGSDTDDFRRGDRVTGLTQYESHAEYIYRSIDDLAHVPDDVDPAEAATLVLNYLVAFQILHRVAHVKAGDKALIIGASGGVGTAFLQLGRLAGLRMYGTASPSKHAVLERYGATPIDYHTEDVAEFVRRHEPDGIDFVFNGMSHQYFGPAMRVLRRGGMLVAFGAPKSFGDFLVLAAKLLGSYVIPNGKSIVGYGTHREGVDSFKEDWAKLFALLAQHRIEPIVEKVLPLDDAIDAYRMLESGAVTGNLVLVSSSGSSEGVESEVSGSTRE